MPYINPEDRKKFEPYLEMVSGLVQNAGEFNYIINMIALDYCRRFGMKYENANAVVGAMESAKQEFYRRFVAPYEDSKIELNGDITG
jgi:hypothetical protein